LRSETLSSDKCVYASDFYSRGISYDWKLTVKSIELYIRNREKILKVRVTAERILIFVKLKKKMAFRLHALTLLNEKLSNGETIWRIIVFTEVKMYEVYPKMHNEHIIINIVERYTISIT